MTSNGEMALILRYCTEFVMAFILHHFTEFVYDVVVKQLLGSSQFQNLHKMTILIPSAQLFLNYLGKTNSDNSV